MLWPEATAGPVPGLRTSVVRLLGAVLFGTVSVGLSPKPPVTPTPTLVVAVPEDDEEDEEPEEPPQAARARGASRLAATMAAPRRADSFTRNLRRRGKRTRPRERPDLCLPFPSGRGESGHGPAHRPERRRRRVVRPLAARRRRGTAPGADQRERGLRLPRGRCADDPRDSGRVRRPRRRRRRPGLLPRPRRVRAPRDGRRPGGPRGRRAVPD